MSQNFKPVKSKKGYPLNLYVGLYYTISVKSIPNCYVTYEPTPREHTNVMQIAFNDTEDYEPGGNSRSSVLWTILPATETNDYFLKVLSMPEGILTYSHSLSWGGRYLELDSTRENYKEGSPMHSSSLWNFNPTELPSYFTIHNSDSRRNQNFVTFSNEPSLNGQLMQIGCKDVNFYDPRGKFRNDALWNFRPSNFNLHAKVCNFEYDLPTHEQLENASIPVRVTENITVHNDTENDRIEIDEKVELQETFRLTFLQSFKPFSEENVKIECNVLSTLTNANVPNLELTKLTNTNWISSKTRSFKVSQTLLLKPKESALVTGFCNWIQSAELPFTATVQLTATSDVAHCPTPVQLHCTNELIADSSITEYLVKYERFTGKILQAKNGVVYCTVSGVIKGSFGLGTRVQVKYL